MNIAILGYGKEGHSVESYFKKRGDKIKIFDNFSPEDVTNFELENYDLVFRSPSIRPNGNFSSITKYFFDHCPCQIIGVTGTKGKGTTCSMIAEILKTLGKKVWLVGNIGLPALDILDQIAPEDVVVYEMSSFQLWDLEKSPHIAVILRIEPDHLNIHKNFDEYVAAKANIAKHQSVSDFCIYFKNNEDSTEIAEKSKGHHLIYPIQNQTETLKNLLNSLNVPGNHNKENAEAALLACAAYYYMPLDDFVAKYESKLLSAFSTFQGLPHRCQFVRELNNVKYYDDNFSTTIPSLEVALQAFPQDKIVLILGGRDKTNGENFPKIVNLLKNTKNIIATILIGEVGHEIFHNFKIPSLNLTLAESLEEAVSVAKQKAEKASPAIVLMSPANASFDMFKNVYDRGDKYQKIINNLK